ncbi:2-aminoethanethiol dioxygenase [Chelonus insularis]|uniref:2-aminoethanethiol dioxygenase n=1 Tax=Chelonus insularis TaxID=460826 RepID=UPI001589003F|nr:2-aminoethanethiol dioxygenase [Chelonus insularis]
MKLFNKSFINIISSFQTPKMATPIELLWKQALKTFTGCENVGYKLCQKNFEKLHSMMNNIKADDVKVDNQVLDYVANTNAPMCVIDIFDNKDITIAVFLLKNGVTLPMHDHPGMYGLLKVISGTVQIDSYTSQTPPGHIIRPNEEIHAIKHASVIVQKTDPACILKPQDHNLHEITCLKGPAAFLDILSPPYKLESENSLGRSCIFFQKISSNSPTSNDSPERVKLRATSEPPASCFYSTNIKYLGPPLR